MAADYRKRVIVSGRVQGVGYRFFTCRLADNFRVTGYVRNLPNGDVEIVAEGEKQEVEAFLSQAARGPSFARIINVRAFVEKPQGNFTSFGVKY